MQAKFDSKEKKEANGLKQKRAVKYGLFLAVILFALDEQIQDLKNSDPEKNKGTINVAENLRNKLKKAITDYKNNPSSDEKLVQKIFIKSCNNAIVEAKALLVGELGWGDYLSYLSKTLSNFFISIVNDVNRMAGYEKRYSFFEPVNAAFISGAEFAVDEVKQEFQLDQ
jgi:hypothetical protein